jgi:ribosome-binding protein aMBF1 (putative translation factor)
MTTWLREDLADTVRSGLRERGRSQSWLAEQTGFTEKHISRALNGRVEGSLTLWATLVEAALGPGDDEHLTANIGIADQLPPWRLR